MMKKLSFCVLNQQSILAFKRNTARNPSNPVEEPVIEYNMPY